MRRPNRNIEIFSMSVLDLFAAALGGFILIAVILFPNYMKQEQAALALNKSRDSLAQCKSAEAASQQVVATKVRELAACEATLASTFVVVAIEWSMTGNFDVDLHVTDPDGHEFFWGRNNRDRRDYPVTEAQLSYDNTRGPGVELWQHPKAQPGMYRIAYDFYSAPALNRSVEVRGNVFYRNGRVELRPVTLTETHKLRTVAQLIVDPRANVEVRFEP